MSDERAVTRPRVVVYCDGACSPNPGVGGWGAVLIAADGARRREISGAEPHSTNNRMELTAALMALRALTRPCEVSVFTDSRYLRDAFEAGWLARWQRTGWRTADRKPVANEDLWRELLELARRHAVSWHWVAAHADDVENNRADALAVAARVALASQSRPGRR